MNYTIASYIMFDFIFVLDFESTCDGNNPKWKNEIIEFPIVALDCKSRVIVEEFREYVKPTLNPILTKYCTDLTGIQQETVDNAKPFPEVFDAMQAWMDAFNEKYNYPSTIFLTCGDWDLETMLPRQARLSNVKIPLYLQKWINVKRPFQNFTKNTGRTGMAQMLEKLNIPLKGRHHSGLDDARNIASIVSTLLKNNVSLTATGESSEKVKKQCGRGY